MIFSLVLGALALFIEFIVLFLPVWSVWPAEFLTGLTYFFKLIANINFIIPVDTLFSCITFFMYFLTLYFIAKIFLQVMNYVRGTGAGLDI